ncbi:MAG TPA: signal peptidase I [Acidimicrobiales bacterium]|nr:signal peptidase I [Acidimicrobiales bacterium]
MTRRIRFLSGAGGVTLALVVITMFATRTVSLVTTHGTSMLPAFHSGDLAVLLTSNQYRVGEIVGYHSPILHTTVLHRIVADKNGVFTFKGDHNSFIDPQKLGSGAVIGRMWLHIPRVGAWLAWVRSPIHAMFITLCVLALAGTLTAGVASRTRLTGRRKRGARHSPLSGSSTVRAASTPTIVALVVAVAFGAFYGTSLFRPLMRPSTRTVAYTQKIGFDYTSPAVLSTTYPDNRVDNGSPVFLKLVRYLDVTARYRIAASEASLLHGTMSLEVQLSGPTGWTRVLASVPQFEFNGASGDAHTTFDLHEAAGYLADVSRETGVSQDAATIRILADVNVHGVIGTSVVDTDYAPNLEFSFDPDELTLAASGTGSTADVASALTPTQSGSVSRAVDVPNRMSVLGRSMNVSTARDIGLVGMLLSLLGALTAFAWARRCARMDEDRLIRTRYGHQLIAIAASPVEGVTSVIDVTAMPALARLADRYDTFILDHDDGRSHTYYVECGSSVYRYRARGSVSVTVPTPGAVQVGPVQVGPVPFTGTSGG